MLIRVVQMRCEVHRSQLQNISILNHSNKQYVYCLCVCLGYFYQKHFIAFCEDSFIFLEKVDARVCWSR